jgi:hypothetical protein
MTFEYNKWVGNTHPFCEVNGMEFFNVHLRTPGRMIVFKGKSSRTPVTFEKLNKVEVDYIKRWITRESISDYLIEPFGNSSVKVKTNVAQKIKQGQNVKPEIEELEEPKSIIEKLLRESE